MNNKELYDRLLSISSQLSELMESNSPSDYYKISPTFKTSSYYSLEGQLPPPAILFNDMKNLNEQIDNTKYSFKESGSPEFCWLYGSIISSGRIARIFEKYGKNSIKIINIASDRYWIILPVINSADSRKVSDVRKEYYDNADDYDWQDDNKYGDERNNTRLNFTPDSKYNVFNVIRHIGRYMDDYYCATVHTLCCKEMAMELNAMNIQSVDINPYGGGNESSAAKINYSEYRLYPKNYMYIDIENDGRAVYGCSVKEYNFNKHDYNSKPMDIYLGDEYRIPKDDIGEIYEKMNELEDKGMYDESDKLWEKTVNFYNRNVLFYLPYPLDSISGAFIDQSVITAFGDRIFMGKNMAVNFSNAFKAMTSHDLKFMKHPLKVHTKNNKISSFELYTPDIPFMERTEGEMSGLPMFYTFKNSIEFALCIADNMNENLKNMLLSSLNPKGWNWSN